MEISSASPLIIDFNYRHSKGLIEIIAFGLLITLLVAIFVKSFKRTLMVKTRGEV